ncbi:hypothetical protein D3C87_1444340 [compost metagenome]
MQQYQATPISQTTIATSTLTSSLNTYADVRSSIVCQAFWVRTLFAGARSFSLNILVKKVLTGIKPIPSPMRPAHRKSFGPKIQNSEAQSLSGAPSPTRQPTTGASSSSPVLTRQGSMTKPNECITAMSKPTRWKKTAYYVVFSATTIESCRLIRTGHRMKTTPLL